MPQTAFTTPPPLGIGATQPALLTSLSHRNHTRHAPRPRIAPLVATLSNPTAAAADLSTDDNICASLGDLRIGHGYDLHRLEAGYPLILGGIDLPHTVGCAAHSDGDAIYHCIVDAILGALALPDIGQLFPDTDPRFKGCSSDVFMTAAYARMRLAGFVIGNLDVTVILERPKLAPHKQSMRENIARLLETPLQSVNLKAKTHEKVDAVGENRAVEVHAVVVLRRDRPAMPPINSFDADAAAAVGADAAQQLLRFATDRATATLASDPAALPDVPSSCAVQRLYETVIARSKSSADSSWTARLFSKGRTKIAQKVGEEAVEVVIGAVTDDSQNVINESADLLYHLCVLWADIGVRPADVFAELQHREGTSGVSEKASRK